VNILGYIATGIAALIAGAFALLVILVMFVALPVSLAAEAKCLERGYPKAYITWNLKRYCSNLEGSVTVRVDELK